MRSRSRERGLSSIELMIYGAVASTAGLIMASLIRTPVNLTQALVRQQQQEMAERAANYPIDDIKSAWSVTIQWAKIDPSHPSYNPTTYTQFIPWFQVHTAPGAGVPYAYICYSYDSVNATVIRRYSTSAPTQPDLCLANDPSSTAQSTITIARQVESPSLSNPLFSKDPAALGVIVVNMQFKVPADGGPKYKKVSVVRRAYVRS